MKKLFKQHYKAIKKRGLINKETDSHDFFVNIVLAAKELSRAIHLKNLTDVGLKQRAIDLMMVAVNLCLWLKIDIEKELKKNIKNHEKNNNT